MALPEQYLLTTKNLDAFFNSILTAQAPPKFTNKFLEQLEFKSTNDRLFIGVLDFVFKRYKEYQLTKGIQKMVSESQHLIS